MEKRNELQIAVIEYAAKKYNINMVEWAEKYGDDFAELYATSNIAEQFENVYDKNPEELFDSIQKQVEELDRLHHH